MKKHRNEGIQRMGIGEYRLRRSPSRRSGFTLVELLVVIAIIGVLVGLIVPAVFAVRRTFNNASVKFEVQSLAAAVEAYRTKYGDYPPDGSDWRIMEAHLRKAFPNILQSELNLLNPNLPTSTSIRNDYEGRVMDPAEALVFFLGGFSTDSQKPFSGKGGPFLNTGTIASPIYQYNPQRENAFYEFNNSRLNFFDDSFARPVTDDLLPVYGSYSSATPYVYFDHRTYQIARGGSIFFNYHKPTPATDPNDALYGVARPLLAASLATAPTAGYEAPKTFQILSPGIDGFYGGQNPVSSGFPVIFSSTGQGYRFNTGLARFEADSAVSKYRLPEHNGKQPMWDNVASCIEPPTFRDTTVNQ
ncbi:type II secretion system protein [Pirellulaceae bacterium SH501]